MRGAPPLTALRSVPQLFIAALLSMLVHQGARIDVSFAAVLGVTLVVVGGIAFSVERWFALRQ